MNLALEKGERVTTGGKGRGETGGEAGEVTGVVADGIRGVRVLHKLPPNTDQITRRHLELAYQFVLSSRLSPGINLR